MEVPVRRLMVGLGLFILFLGAIPAVAQGQERFASVSVEIWPEYDRPEVLVITGIRLPPAALLPAQMTLRIPSRATLWAVAWVDSSGGLVNAEYTRQVQGEWTQLNISASSSQIQVEYYDVLSKNGSARHIAYLWPGDAAVDAFSAEFQQPIGATDLVLAPAAASSSTNRGMTNYQTGTVQLAAGQIYTLTADYQKQTDDLSVTKLPVETAQSGWLDTIKGVFTNQTLTIAAGVIAGLLLIGGAIGAVSMRRDRKRVASRPRHSGSRGTSRAPVEAIYCSQCGKRARPEDAFCRSCGARLRKHA